jgi:hypothetical protein
MSRPLNVLAGVSPIGIRISAWPEKLLTGSPAPSSPSPDLIRGSKRTSSVEAIPARLEKFVPIEALVSFSTENDGGPRREIPLEHRDLTERIIGLAIEVHRTIGPGLLESVNEACLGPERPTGRE